MLYKFSNNRFPFLKMIEYQGAESGIICDIFSADRIRIAEI
jgi:hypothetical protein